MKWFFAFNQASEANYGDFVRVAVLSARRTNDFHAFCLYDGAPGELTRWLEKQNVTVLPTRFRFAAWWEELAQKQNSALVAQIALGTFLRFELPDITQREGLNDEFALYTDCDVVFERPIKPILEPLRPRFFAVAPETFPRNRLHMNAGVMWMNLPALRAQNARLMAFAEKHMEEASWSAFDQGIYRAYFNWPHRLAWKLGVRDRYFYALMSRLPLKTWKWDDLPLELNWKPYWGENPDIGILHFHGLKPTQRAQLERGELPPNIASMHNDFWEKCATRWENLLLEARKL